MKAARSGFYNISFVGGARGEQGALRSCPRKKI